MPRPRPPRWLKRLLLPAWNGGHRLARSVGEVVVAVVQRRFGRCTCCGAFAAMLYRRRAVSDRLVELWGLSPRLAEALRRKESLACSSCGAKLRARRMARVLLDLHPAGSAASLRDWAQAGPIRALRVAELNRVDGLHESIDGLPGLCFSDFRDDVPRGSYADDVRNEDLLALTYADGSFDLVLTSETLEHVPDLTAALAEVRRVLRPGGRHVFTVPVLPGVETTFARAVVDPDGAVRHLSTPIRHPGGDVGYPVFTEFGADLPAILRASGFEVEVRFGPTTEDDLAQVYVCRKPGGDGTSAPGPDSLLSRGP